MTVKDGDLKLLESKVMDDVPEGGGGPTGNVIPWGKSNAIFPDITEVDRAGGDVSIRQLFAAVQTPDVEPLMDANIILTEMPNDPNVSVTLAACAPFAKRTDIASVIAAYLIPGTEWNGVLLENHVQGQASIKIYHRIGTPAPTIGRTLVLVLNEGAANQVMQYVRVLRAETVTQTFTYNSNGAYVDFEASVTTCEITPRLNAAFPGSAPNRLFAVDANKTRIRDTTVADAATYYGAQPLSAAVTLGQSVLRVASIYTQLVPNSRTERTELDVMPASIRTVVLQESPRRVEIGASPHSRRLKIGQENRAFSYVDILKPIPAPGTIDVSYMALGNWYSLTDDGSGKLSGAGVGTINYATGSISITLQAMPDASSAVIYTWGEKIGFNNRAGQAGFRAPEHAFQIAQAGIVPGSVTIKWLSGGVLRTATANVSGIIAGDATGEVNYATSGVLIRPNFMIDPGGEFAVECQYTSMRTENFTGLAPDAGGFAAIGLAESPAPGSISVRWVTVRNISKTSGGESAASSGKSASSKVVSYSGGTTGSVEPASYTRVPFTGSAPTNGGGWVYGMYPGGKLFDGTAVYIAIEPTLGVDGTSYEYVIPDTSGVVWSVEDYQNGVKAIGGHPYQRWGRQT